MPDENFGPPSETILLVFIVNGEDVPVFAERTAPLLKARAEALAISHNTGRPPEEWDVRDERGMRLNADQRVETFNFKERGRLFLTLKVGVGGGIDDF